MKLSRLTCAGAILTALCWGVNATADGGGHHGGREADSGQEEHGSAGDLAGAWSSLEAARDSIAGDVAAGNLESIHEAAEPIPVLGEALLKHLDGIGTAKEARVKGAVRQLPRVADGLHEAADAGDADRTRSQLKRLDGLLMIIRAQLPSDALGESPAHGDGGRHGANHSHRGASAHVSEQAAAALRVVSDDFAFEPGEIRLRVGEPTRIELRNVGKIEHALVVRTLDGGADAIQLHAQPGATDVATVRLDQAGSYQLVYTIPGHSEVGMAGRVIAVNGSDV